MAKAIFRTIVLWWGRYKMWQLQKIWRLRPLCPVVLDVWVGSGREALGVKGSFVHRDNMQPESKAFSSKAFPLAKSVSACWYSMATTIPQTPLNFDNSRVFNLEAAEAFFWIPSWELVKAVRLISRLVCTIARPIVGWLKPGSSFTYILLYFVSSSFPHPPHVCVYGQWRSSVCRFRGNQGGVLRSMMVPVRWTS